MTGRFRTIALVVVTGITISALAGCSRHSSTDRSRAAMSERQRDSTIAKSRLPGAGTVGKAVAASDSAAARAARIDSLLRRAGRN